MKTHHSATRTGQWIITKYRAQARRVGYQRVAANLRKQGVPLAIARLVLLGVR